MSLPLLQLHPMSLDSMIFLFPGPRKGKSKKVTRESDLNRVPTYITDSAVSSHTLSHLILKVTHLLGFITHFRDNKTKTQRYPSPQSCTTCRNRKRLQSLDLFKFRNKKRLYSLQKNPPQWMRPRLTQKKGVREPSAWSPDTGFNKQHPLYAPTIIVLFMLVGVQTCITLPKKARDIRSCTQ